MLLHKAVIELRHRENRLLAAPASVHPAADTSGGQEDFQARTDSSPREKLARDPRQRPELIVASELVAARQASHLGGRTLPPRLEAAVERLAGCVEPVGEDRGLGEDVERVLALMRSGGLG